jgi:glyoxylase-like metal-dependent hydrolase (beta-lactamase superfamily II)
MKLLIVIFIFILSFTAAKSTYAKGVEPAVIKKINQNFYLLSTPSVSHLGLIIGDSALVLVDTGLVTESEMVLAAIKKISDKPIKYVLNTHHHPDHSGGNRFFAKLGATIITQENTLYTATYSQVRYKDSYSLDIGNETIELFHKVSHTYNDTIIHLKNSNAVFMGDNLSTHAFLSVGEKGLAGHNAVYDFALSLADKNTIVIPSHAGRDKQGNRLVNKQALYAYKQKSQSWIKRLGELKKQAFNITEIKKDSKLRDLTQAFAVDEKRNNPADHFGLSWSVTKSLELEFYSRKKITKQQLQSYVGIYKLNKQIKVEIFTKDEKLFAREEGRYFVELIPISEHLFDMKGYFFDENKEKIIFNQSQNNEVESLNVIIDDTSRWGYKGWDFLSEISRGIIKKQ